MINQKRDDFFPEFLEGDKNFITAILEHIPGVLFLSDAVGRLVWWNTVHRDVIVGSKPDSEMLHRDVLELFHLDDKVVAQESMQRILEQGIELMFEARVMLFDGPKCQWRMISAKRITSNGYPFIIALSLDISERKRFELLIAFRLRLLEMVETHSVEELLQATLDEAEHQTESSIGFCHFAAVDKGLLSHHVSSTRAKSLNIRHEYESYLSISEKTLSAALLGEEKALFYNDANPLICNELFDSCGEMERRIVIPVKRDQSVVAIFCVGGKSWEYDDDDAKIVSDLVAIGWNMVLLKRAQQLAQRRQEALLTAQKMALVGQFGVGIAHHINSTIDEILSSVMTVFEREPLPLLLKPLHSILQATEQSVELTNQLFAFSRQQTVMPVLLELNLVMERSLPQLQRLLGGHITFEWHPESCSTSVNVDPIQFDQLLKNLCLNSCDAFAGSGTITIATRRITIDNATADVCNEAGDYVMLSVSDDGVGIEKKDLPHIFEPFFSTKKRENGRQRGLGLAAVYGIVKQHDGSITCQSEKGKGTTITIALRHVSDDAATNENATRELSRRVGNKRILLVDDDKDLHTLLRLMLDEQGYTVLRAATAADALNMANQTEEEIDLLLTNVVLPEIHGCDLSKTLQTRCPAMKTLFMTEMMGNHPCHEERETGLFFLQKPFSTKKLLAVLTEIFGSSESL